MQVIYSVLMLNRWIMIFGNDVVVVIFLLKVWKCSISMVQVQQIELVSSRFIISVLGKLCLGCLNFEVRCVKVFRLIKYQNIIDSVEKSCLWLIFVGVGKGICVGFILLCYQIMMISVIISMVINVCRLVLELVLCELIYQMMVRVFSFVSSSCVLCQLNSVWLKLVVMCRVVGSLIGIIDKNSQLVMLVRCGLKVILIKWVMLFVLGKWWFSRVKMMVIGKIRRMSSGYVYRLLLLVISVVSVGMVKMLVFSNEVESNLIFCFSFNFCFKLFMI